MVGVYDYNLAGAHEEPVVLSNRVSCGFEESCVNGASSLERDAWSSMLLQIKVTNGPLRIRCRSGPFPGMVLPKPYARLLAIIRANVTVRPHALPVERLGYVME